MYIFHSTVIIICANGPRVREIMLAAYDMGLINGEYTFLSTYPYNNTFLYGNGNWNQVCWTYTIRRRSDYIIGFIAPEIGPNKSRKLTRLIPLALNIRGKVWMKNNVHGFKANNCLSVKPWWFFLFKLYRVYCVLAL